MNIQKYMAFVKTVELGSFTKAARELKYSQSGISRMINDLEIEWGITLLKRDRSGVQVTSEGLKLFPLIQDICSNQVHLESQLEELHGLQSGLIRIGTFSSVATHWLPNIIKHFKSDYPNIEFELLLGDYTEIETWIAQGRVDCGFLRLPTKSSDFDVTFLEEDKLMVILPLSHPMSDCESFPIQSLSNEPFILLEKGGKADISDVLEHYHIAPDIRYKTWDDYAIMSMVENNLGISILPELILNRIPYKIVMKELDVPASRKIGIVRKNAKTIPLAVKQFYEYLQYRH